ncbi:MULTISPECIES: hypothetical protein [unclassified Streptomyces]|uniref:hypothetical protein n=1 Tax=unclassified Streptomyces TaxID=2593676 RepID=UPI001BE54652|nr:MULTISPECIES: hypothetical protein [unclassified Streptomyces]MBT2408690.1 hypothetical protein [Streptomyces sp. ISL-21]MBT2613224.1 hypothetical protein [Streptomyces sp. ISL-87]
MGLCLFPGDGDLTSPDISWSYSGFNAFRQRLAQAEGFTLPDMWGFGGDREWSEISSTLKPLLDHPDDAGDLSAADCARILPRLAEIITEWETAESNPALTRHIEDARQLVAVLKICVDSNVELLFG